MKYISLKPDDKPITLALTAKSGFCQVACRAALGETNKAVLEGEPTIIVTRCHFIGDYPFQSLYFVENKISIDQLFHFAIIIGIIIYFYLRFS